MEIRKELKKTEVRESYCRPIRVIRILGRMNIGGPSVHVALLTSGLNNERFRSTLVTGTIGQSEGDMLYMARQYGVTPHIISQLGRDNSWRNDLVAWWKLCRLLKRERPDIVHTHTAKAGALGRLAAALTGVPVKIHTFHGHVFHGYFGPFKSGLYVLIERLLSLLTTKIIAISSAQRKELCDRFRIATRIKFRVIPIGLDLQPFLQLPVERQLSARGPSGQEFIGFIGRLVTVKNPKLAVQAFAQVLQKQTASANSRLLFVGDGELRSEMERLIQSVRLGDRIQFLGWIKDLREIYAKLAFVIVTSLNEGTPVVLIEAMAAGIPFVATSVGGIADLVVGPGHVVRDLEGKALFTVYLNGILVESGDVSGFASAMDFVLADPERRLQMGLAGRNFVRDRFSKDRLLEDMGQLYVECLEKSNRGMSPLMRSTH